MKKYLAPLILIYLAALLQRSVFSLWGFGPWKPQSPQLLVIVVFFLLNREFESESVWFIFFYFFFGEMLAGSPYPGLASLIVIISIWGLQKLRQRLLRGFLFSWVLLFVSLCGLVYLTENLSQATPVGFLVQLVVNGLSFFIFYPVLYLIFWMLAPQTPSQLSLRI